MTATRGHRTTTCGTCGDRIIWCRTHNGKRMPVDVEPTPDGNLLLSKDRVPVATVVIRSNCREGELHKSHFATCRRPPRQRRRTSPVPPAPPTAGAAAERVPLFGDAR